MRPYPPYFGSAEVAALARALHALLPSREIPGPRLPLPERQALAARCTALCQAAHLRAQESVVIAEALIGAVHGWVGLSEPLTEAIAAAQVRLALCAEHGRGAQPVVTLGSLRAFLATVLWESDQEWEAEGGRSC